MLRRYIKEMKISSERLTQLNTALDAALASAKACTDDCAVVGRCKWQPGSPCRLLAVLETSIRHMLLSFAFIFTFCPYIEEWETVEEISSAKARATNAD
jgi:hypothetical protein